MTREKGVVVYRSKGFYYLRTDTENEIECKVKGLLFKNSRFNNQIAVGDIVYFSRNTLDRLGVIDEIEERRSYLSRSRVGIEAEQIIAANVDYLLIIASTQQPAFRSNLVNRLLVAAAVGNVKPVLVITKTDLVHPTKIAAITALYHNTDLPIITSGFLDTAPNDSLNSLLSNHICLLAGQSGAGKSSLLNRYFPWLKIRVGEVSLKTSKGAHTTSYARMYRIADQGFVIDTPGIREFGLWQVTSDNLADFFPRIREFYRQCRHRDCKHIHEPGCIIKEAVARGEINRELYAGYVAIYDSLFRH